MPFSIDNGSLRRNGARSRADGAAVGPCRRGAPSRLRNRAAIAPPRHRAVTASSAGRWWRRGARSGGPTASPPPRAPWRGCASAARAPGPDRRYRGRVAPARPRTVELPVAENEALGRDRWSSCENTIDSATVDLRFEVRAQTGDRGGRPTVHPGRPSVERIGSMSHTQMAVAVKDGRWCRRLPR